MIRPGESVFVDTGAFIALALTRDPLHDRAVPVWEALGRKGARFHTSIPVMIETFTFLDRNTTRQVARAWRSATERVPRLRIHECRRADLDAAWSWFDREDLAKLSAVDATSFVIMQRAKIRLAFAFDHHFAAAGFRLAG